MLAETQKYFIFFASRHVQTAEKISYDMVFNICCV